MFYQCSNSIAWYTRGGSSSSGIQAREECGSGFQGMSLETAQEAEPGVRGTSAQPIRCLQWDLQHVP